MLGQSHRPWQGRECGEGQGLGRKLLLSPLGNRLQGSYYTQSGILSWTCNY